MSLSARLDPLFAPAPDAARVAWLRAAPFAHRGLHGVIDGQTLVENSLGAFAAAIAAGHGMECDVRASADGVAFVFHDAGFARLTEATGDLCDRSAAEIDAIRFRAGHEAVPRLSALLALIGGRQALLIEIKSPERGSHLPICRAVAAELADYAGPAAIMSFNPLIVRWFARHWPDVVRGLVVTEQDKKGLRGRIERRLSLWQARPDFLAWDIRDLPSRFPLAQRARGLPLLSWTVRTPAQQETARLYIDQPIYERPA